jgi:hypothetical protein
VRGRALELQRAQLLLISKLQLLLAHMRAGAGKASSNSEKLWLDGWDPVGDQERLEVGRCLGANGRSRLIRKNIISSIACITMWLLYRDQLLIYIIPPHIAVHAIIPIIYKLLPLNPLLPTQRC